MERQEKSLKKILGRGDLFSMAVGQIIGAEVMSLCGVAIGMTGTGVVLAFVLAAVISCTSLLPAAQVLLHVRPPEEHTVIQADCWEQKQDFLKSWYIFFVRLQCQCMRLPLQLIFRILSQESI